MSSSRHVSPRVASKPSDSGEKPHDDGAPPVAVRQPPDPLTPGEVQQIPFWVLHAGSLFPHAVTVFKGLPHRNSIHADWVLSDMHERADVFDDANACAELILAVADAISIPLADPGKLSSMVKRLKSAGVSQELAGALDELMLRLGIGD